MHMYVNYTRNLEKNNNLWGEGLLTIILYCMIVGAKWMFFQQSARSQDC
jgi:ATP-dependent Zn protease